MKLFSFFFQLAELTFKEALGDGIWLDIMDGKIPIADMDSAACAVKYKDIKLFQLLEADGYSLELPWYKVSALFNFARLLEQLHNTEKASILYRLIIFKVFTLALFCVCMNYIHLFFRIVFMKYFLLFAVN